MVELQVILNPNENVSWSLVNYKVIDIIPSQKTSEGKLILLSITKKWGSYS